MSTKPKWKTEFAKSKIGAKATWDGWAQNAEYDRAVMMSEFHGWAVAKRQSVEEKIIGNKHHQISCEPFARAGLDSAETPADVPMVVLEFAITSLALLEAQRKMALLDVYYKRAGNWGGGQETLQVESCDEAEINALWQWFMEDREEKSEKAQ